MMMMVMIIVTRIKITGSALINQNRVSSIDYLTRHQEQICELKRASYAKLVPISDRSLLVIGGQQQSARSS